MFQVGAYIMYGRSGVCKVTAVGHPEMTGFDSERLYYTLEPVYGSETIFIPVDSPVAMREVVSKAEAQQLLTQIPAQIKAHQAVQAKVEQRELANFYKGLLANCDMQDWIRLLAYVYGKRATMEQGGKKLCQTDKLYESKAEELLQGELAAALALEKDQIAEVIGYHALLA